MEKERYVSLQQPAREQLVTVCGLQPNDLRRKAAPVRSLRQLVERTTELRLLPSRVQTRHAFTPSEVDHFLRRMMREPELLQSFVIVSGNVDGNEFQLLEMDLNAMARRRQNLTGLWFMNPMSLGDSDVMTVNGVPNVELKVEFDGKTMRIAPSPRSYVPAQNR